MPLYKIIDPNEKTRILIWEITESFEALRSKLVLKEETQIRLDGMKSDLHKRGFLSVRMLLQEAGFDDFDLHYDDFGKPYLHCHNHISITHSHHFSAIIISEEAVGIDIELQRQKILRIADKFVKAEASYLSRDSGSQNANDYIRKLTVVWGAKEAIFKISNERGISFKEHIRVASFLLDQNKTQASLHFDDWIKNFEVNYLQIDSSNSQQEKQNFTLVYVFEKGVQ